MSARDCFGVVVRSIGLAVLLFGLYQLLTLVYMIVAVGTHVLPVWLPVVTALLECALGYYLLTGGGVFVRMAYPGAQQGG